MPAVSMYQNIKPFLQLDCRIFVESLESYLLHPEKNTTSSPTWIFSLSMFLPKKKQHSFSQDMWATCEKPLVCLRGSCVKADGRWWDAHGISAARMGPELLSAALQEAGDTWTTTWWFQMFFFIPTWEEDLIGWLNH